MTSRPVPPGIPLRDVVDALPRAIVVTDEAGAIVLWNAAAEQLYGWSEADVIGHPASELLTPDERGSGRAGGGRQVPPAPPAGQASHGDRTVQRRDGTRIRVLEITKALYDQSGEVMALVTASEDVTDLRRLERRADDLTEHLRLALDSAGLGTWRWDIASGEVRWDERMEALFGLPPGGFDGTYESYLAALHPDDRAKVLETVEAATRTRQPYRVEHRVVWPDGSVHWMSGAGTVTVGPDGEVTGSIGCSADVTEQVRAGLEREAAARAAEKAAELERVNRERFEFLTRVNDALAAAHTPEQIMVNVTRAAVPHLGDWCSMYVLPDSTATVPLIETFHVDPAMVSYARTLLQQFPYDPDAASGVPHVIRSGQAEFYPEISDDVLETVTLDEEARAIVRKLAFRSAIVVPMIKNGRVLGAVQFVTTHTSRQYTAEDLALAQAAAARIAASLENRRLAVQHRLIAKTLQDSLLPRELPDIATLDVAVRYWAAGEGTEVGGDFYDVFAADDETWAAVIGDVCGTGPTAASLTSLARHTIRQAAWRGDDPAHVLTWLNRALREAQQDSFLTAAFLLLRCAPDGCEVELALAGHPLPVLVGADGTARAVGRSGQLVGVFDAVVSHPVTLRLHPDDTLVLYTDGITDVPPPHDLNEDELRELVASCVRGAQCAEEVADRIHAALADLLPIEERSDDMAILVIRHRRAADAEGA